jgi:hypothetical protein
MWGNLAGRLKENLDVGDLRETISRIGDVVAPPLDSDEEYETDEEYEYYEEEEEEIVMQEEEDEEQTPTLGYMLQHALDEEEETHHQLEEEQQQQHDQDRHARPLLPDAEGDDDNINAPLPFAATRTAVATREADDFTVSNKEAAAAASLDWSSLLEPRHVPGVAVPHVHKVVSLDDAVHYKGHFQNTTTTTTTTSSDSKVQSQTMPVFSESSSVLDVVEEAHYPPSKVISNGPPLVEESHKKMMPLPPEPKVTEPKTNVESKLCTQKVKPKLTNEHDSQPPTFIPNDHESRAAATKESSAQNVEPKPKQSNDVHSHPMPASSSSAHGSTFPAQELRGANVEPKVKQTNAMMQSPPMPASVSSVKESRFAVTELSPANVGLKPELPNARQLPPMPSPVLSSTVEPRLAAKESNLDNVEPEPKNAHDVQSLLVPVPLSNLPTSKEKVVPTVPAPRPPLAVASSVLSVQSEPKHKDKVSIAQVSSLPPAVNHSVEAGRMPAMDSAPKQTNSQTPLEKGGEMEHLTVRCQELEKLLVHAETHIVELQQDAARRMDEEEEWRQLHLRQFQEKQASMVEASIEAAAEEHKRELVEMRDLLQQECLALKDQLQQERTESQQQSVQFRRLLEEQEARAKAAENEKRLVVSKLKSSSSQLQQQQERSVRMAEEKLAHTMARLDEREDEVRQLKGSLKQLKATTTEHRKGAEEAEEEMDELHGENEMLRRNLHSAEAERDELTKQLKLFESQKEKTSGLQVCVHVCVEREIMIYLTISPSHVISLDLDGAKNAKRSPGSRTIPSGICCC